MAETARSQRSSRTTSAARNPQPRRPVPRTPGGIAPAEPGTVTRRPIQPDRATTPRPAPAPARAEPRPAPSPGTSRDRDGFGTATQREAGRGIATVQAGLGQGGQHALAAELLLFVGIVALRAVATYGPAPKGGKDLPADQFGPLFILGNGFAAFFVLAFLAARGGTSARIAVAGGLLIDVALLMKSVPHIDQIAAVYAEPRKYKPLDLEGTYATGDASVLPPALALELQTGQLPPAPKGKSAAAAMSYARKSLTAFGLRLTEWGDLVRLWNRESGWNYRATNPSSGAYGIPQSLPAGKMASAGADWKTNPFTQIRWGLGYIRQRYGSISAAWAHEQHFGWY